MRLLSTRGLRALVLFTFAAGGLLISLLFATITYLSVRHYTVEQRESSALRQSYNDAARVHSALRRGADIQASLDAVHAATHARIHVRVGEQWYSAPSGTRRRPIRHVIPVVRAGSVAFSWTSATKSPAGVVGIPLPSVGAEYYEIVGARKLQSTLTTIETALVISTVVTTAAGIVLGWFASRRVLGPLNDVATAAARIAAGELDTRLPATPDRDLSVLVNSFNTMVEGVVGRIEHDARFAANVSHELRTPVATLTTSLGVLQHAPELSERSRTVVSIMDTELVRFRQALEDLIALERLDSVTGTSERETVSVFDVVAHVAREHQIGADLIQIPGELHGLEVEVDQLQIRRALSNLIRNAKAHAGGLTAIRRARVGDDVEIHVEDQGPGVPEEDRERIFERFTRIGARGSGAGSGLGLSIVARAAAVHAGRVECRPNTPRGTDFVFTLPLATGATTEETAP